MFLRLHRKLLKPHYALLMKKEILIYILLSSIVYIYVLIRAIKIDITYDEASTITDYVNLNYYSVIRSYDCAANNHILNTILIKFLYGIDLRGIFFARLPNVLACILFLFYSYKISSTYFSKLPGFVFFASITFNPFLLDFFSLARGYGLELSFETASVFYFLRLIKENKSIYMNISIFFSALAVLSNFSVLNYHLALIVSIITITLYKKKSFGIKDGWKSFFLINLGLCGIIFQPIKRLKQNGGMYYGGNTDFYHDTIVSLTKSSLYYADSNLKTSIVAISFLTIFSICFVLYFLNIFKRKIHKQSEITLFSLLLLLLSVLSSIIQHYAIGTLYLLDRTALFYLPIISLTMSLFYQQLNFLTIKSIQILQLFFLAINLIININLYKTAIWYFDSHTATILTYLNSIGEKNNKLIYLDFSWPFRSSIYYYCNNNLFPFIKIVKDKNNNSIVNEHANYYLYLDKSLNLSNYKTKDQRILNLKKDTIFSFKNESVYLFYNIR